jgi:hypothetical protein
MFWQGRIPAAWASVIGATLAKPGHKGKAGAEPTRL